MTPATAPAGCPCLAGDPSAFYVARHANATYALLEALVTASSRGADEPGSWNAVVRPQLLERRRFAPVLWRVDDFILNLTLPQVLAYDLEAPETLTLVTPREAVLSDQPIPMPPVVVFPIAGGERHVGWRADGALMAP